MQSVKASNIGRYRILGEIGRGAMGVVYKAHDPTIDRIVALKTILLPEHQSAEHKKFRERFSLEARAAGRLSHPCIVTIYDVGEDSQTETPFIVMEYVDGESLEKQVSDIGGDFPPECALALVRELACALDYAHSQGIVHRDIKPSNVLLATDGRPKITDFGVAKLNTAYQTAAGEALGTPAYMSPEQLNGDPVDGRSDLFSLGVILYTLLTGHRPFQGNSAMTVSFRVVHRDPLPVSAYDSDFPPDVDYVIGRAIAKDPAARYQTGNEMADDLADLQEGRVPRSKENHVTTLLHSHQQSSPTQIPSDPRRPMLPERLTGRRSSAKDDARPRVTAWEYAMFIVLAAAVAAMAFALFRPAPANSLLPRSALPRSSTSRASDFQDSAASSQPGPLKSSNSIAPSFPAESHLDPKPQPEVRAAVKNSAQVSVSPVADVATGRTVAPVAVQHTASLHIRVEHRFPAAQVLVWVDDKLAYKEALDGMVKRRMGVFKKVEGYKSDTLQLPSGEHKIRVRVQSSDSSYDRTQTVSGLIPDDGERELKIDCTNRKQIQLTIQ